MGDLQLSWSSDRSLRISIEKGDRDQDLTLAWVRALAKTLSTAAPVWVEEIVPSAGSVMVVVDPMRVTAEEALGVLGELAGRVGHATTSQDVAGRQIVIPVCYEEAYAPDLGSVALRAGLDRDEVVQRHGGGAYTVVAMGFSPGFGYLCGLDHRLHLPRRDVPRERVPAGSVAIASDRTGVYPHATPGGWHLIGRTSMRLFDSQLASPACLSVGDSVRFEPISAAAFARLEAGG